ncbi:MAG: hypothetical protein ACK6DZ_09905 [Acidobacteriota bacterium]
MFPALLLAFQLPFSLPDLLEQWKSEIEARTFNRIEILRIPGDPVPAEDRDVLFSYFSRPDFAQSFARTQALTFRYERDGHNRGLILLNLPRLQSTQNSLPSLIAHELGHLWLASLGHNPPPYDAGPAPASPSTPAISSSTSSSAPSPTAAPSPGAIPISAITPPPLTPFAPRPPAALATIASAPNASAS